MNTNEFTRRAIEEKIAAMGDYVKISYLSNSLKKSLDFDTRKFVLTTLSRLYEDRKMLNEAGKMLSFSADINTTFNGKITDFLKSTELFIKGGSYDEADMSFKKALAVANTSQKTELKKRVKDMYQVQAKEYLARDKRKNAVKAYEKLLSLDLDPQEKDAIKAKLVVLYESLGKVREFYNMRKSLGL